ncbi:MAG: SH3 domain-containing protein [Desulfuromonadaceae bacterium]|nr:SH3 domain-containing protein [Desulfuromonadaceae bacterium]MDD5107198.1 SH3 domain-containing protein [Desulfuromonadaceae bacterium]
MKCLPAILIFLILFTTTASGEQLFYVQGARTNVYSQPLLRSMLLGELRQGESISPSARIGNWYKILFAHKDGYVSSFAVAPYPPLAKVASSTENRSRDTENPRERRSTAPTIVAGVKGLAYEDRMRRHGGQKVDFISLDTMEGLRIAPEELETFAKGVAP